MKPASKLLRDEFYTECTLLLIRSRMPEWVTLVSDERLQFITSTSGYLQRQKTSLQVQVIAWKMAVAMLPVLKAAERACQLFVEAARKVGVK